MAGAGPAGRRAACRRPSCATPTFPTTSSRRLGYQLAHHGEGAVERRGHRQPLAHRGRDHQLRRAAAGGAHARRRRRRAAGRGAHDRRPDRRAAGGVALRAQRPGGRFAVLPGEAGLVRSPGGLAGRAPARADEPLVLGGDLNVAPTDADVWDARACHGGTHVSPPERAAFDRLCAWGLVDAYRLHHQEGERFTWWDYRAGHFHKNFGMRIDHLLVTGPVASRTVWAEIDREARKGTPIPSDHAPLHHRCRCARTTDRRRLGRARTSGSPPAASPAAGRIHRVGIPDGRLAVRVGSGLTPQLFPCPRPCPRPCPIRKSHPGTGAGTGAGTNPERFPRRPIYTIVPTRRRRHA